MKTLKTKGILLVVFLITGLFAYAQPSNNQCANAIPLTPSSGTCNSATYTNVGANTSAGDPVPACWAPATISHNVWFSFVATNTTVEISTNFGGMTLTNTQIAVYSGNCGSLTQIACNEDINTGSGLLTNDIIINGLTLGNTYYIMIDGNGNSTGTFGICVQNIPAPGPPAADQDCSTATFLCNGNSFTIPGGAYNTGLTVESPTCFGAPGERASHWYSFTAANNGNLAFTIKPATPIDYDFAVYDITNGCMGTQLACNWTACTGSPTNNGWTGLGCANTNNCSLISSRSCDPVIPMTAGRTYAILVDRYTAAATSGFTMDFTGSTMGFAGPTADFSATTVCQGNTTTFTDLSKATGVLTYSWNFGDGSTSTSPNPTHTYATAGTYNVTLIITTNPGNCQNAISKSVVVTPGPTVSINPAAPTICAGGSVNLNGTATPNPTGNYSKTFSNNTAASIPDAGVTTTWTGTGGTFTSSTINVSGINPAAWSIASLCLNITHPRDGQLYIYLVCPNGTVLNLSTGNGGNNANYTNTCFNPTASINITAGAAPFTGSFLPEANFSGLAGCNPNGTWTLRIGDATGGSTGTLNNWTLSLSSTAAIASYLWTPPTNLTSTTTANTTANPNATRTYTLTATDYQGCVGSANVVVTVTTPILTVSSTTNATCGGSATGSATVSGSAGTAPYSYSWSNGATGATASGLAAGTYTVTSTDATGCTATASVTITQPSPVVPAISSQTNVSCNGGSNGSATISANGGTGPYNYNWGGGITGATRNTLAAGTYTVTVSDANSCTGTISVTITEPSALAVSLVSKTDVLCNGANTGSITTSSTGGTPGYSYNWSNGSSMSSIASLAAGTYTITVTDSKSCTASLSVTITQPSALSASIVSQTNINCNGGNTGGAVSTGNGGTSPYTYTWSTGTTTASISNVAVGTYTVTVKDANNCTASTSVTITQLPALTANISTKTDIFCSGASTGSATVVGGGNTSTPYTFNWSTGATSSTINGLAAGTYTVTVTDANSCTASTTVTINQLPPVAINLVSKTDPKCNNANNGSISVSGSAGNTPYTFSWSNSMTGASISGIAAGTYTVTITDANSCTATLSVTLNNPSPLIVSLVNKVDVSCSGGATGSITVGVSGGTNPLTYNWSNSASTNPISSLTAGTYTVTVTDANSCTGSLAVTISQPSPLSATITPNSPGCNGASNGSATANPSGGTSPYNYSWNTSPIQNTATASNLAAGNYTVTITDASSCTFTVSTTITQPGVMTASVSVVNPSCNGASNGTATASQTGGVSPYIYNWSTSPSQSGVTATNLNAGSYTVTITDNTGCTATANGTLVEPSLLTATLGGSVNPSCSSANDGSITIVANGGTNPYTYSWNTIPAQTAATASNLAAGSFTVTVTDSKGCTATLSTTMVAPAGLTASTSHNDAACFGTATGSATVNVGGGTSPYSYIWNSSPVQTGATANNLAKGTYSVTVTDLKNCSIQATVTINEPDALTAIAVGTDVSCKGASTGSATVVPSDGTAPYSYKWSTSPNQFTASINGIAAGSYSVTVTDSKMCTYTTNVSINEPASLTITASGIDVTCKGMNNGTATSVVTGGTAPYTYKWNTSPIQTTSSANNLGAGSYKVTVTDNNGCTASASVTINEPTLPLSVTTTGINENCNQKDGTVTAVATGGTSPYTYAWNTTPVQTTAVATGLAGGTYIVTITDAKGCTATSSVTINNVGAPVGNVILVIDVTKNGGNDGTATVGATGGILPYTFKWSTNPVQTGPIGIGLGAGTYTVTITGLNGCTASVQVVINQPAAVSSVNSQVDVNCFGASTGSATVNVSGGVAPYNYLWNTTPAQNTATASNLAAGNYIVTITDKNGATHTESFTITEPADITISNTVTNVSCNGGLNGKIALNVTGGTSPYTYVWNTSPVQNTSTASNLTAGVYQVTVTDANSCTKTSLVNVSEPSVLSSSTSSTDENCNDGKGSATVITNGGVSPYTYNWSNSGTSSTINNINGGNYTVTITDANNCTITNSIVVNNVGGPSASISSSTDVTVNGGSDGSASVNVSGGVTPYTYSWNTTPPQTTATATNLAAGTYIVTVSGANGCIITASVVISQPGALASTGSTTDVTCNGGNNGSAKITPNGGIAPYTYSWNTTPVQTTASISGLSAGTYTVTITDSKGATSTSSVTINEPTLITIAGVIKNTTCNMGSDGEIQLNTSGGTPNYSYNWSTSPAQTSDNVSGLAAGNYTVTVTDQNSCTATKQFTVNEPAAIVVSASGTDENCNSKDGSVSASVISGGSAPFTYNWNTSPSQFTSTASAISAGSYTVTVTDNKGCTGTANWTINNAGAPIATIVSSTNVTVNGGTNGSATVSASGGSTPYNYSWNTSPVQTTATASGLSAGTYFVTVTGANGCTAGASVNITEPQAFIVDTAKTAISCFGGNDGSVTVIPSGGTPPYTYSWNTIPVQTTATASGLTTGVYKVTITDANGGKANKTITLTQPSTINANVSSVTNVLCNGASTGSASISVSGGTPGYTYSWPSGGSSATKSGLAAGSYNVTITDSKSCKKIVPVSITQPTALSALVNVTKNTSCNGGNDGGATVSANGGKSPYSYKWPNGTTTANVTGLSAGVYTVTVSDANMCSTTANATINQPTVIVVTNTAKTNVACFGTNTGSATISASGGNGAFTYKWNTTPIQTTATANSLGAGNYTVTVTDSKSCTNTLTVTINQTSLFVANINSKTDITCNGANDGAASVNVTGGTAPFTYSWSNSANTSTVSGLNAGKHTVTVTDANGCMSVSDTTINEPSMVSISVNTIKDASCFGKADGSITINTTGGNGGYTYLWSNGANTSSLSLLTSGNYTVTVSDSKSCTATSTLMVNEPSAVQSTFINQVNVKCNAALTGSVEVDATGGTAPYTYNWSNSSSDSTLKNVGAGTYTVTITDKNLCTLQNSVSITEPSALSSNPIVNNVTCNKGSNGQVVLTVNGGVYPYQYNWSNGDLDSVANGLKAGNYVVTITDANSCTLTSNHTVTEPNPIQLSVTLNNDTICINGTSTLSANVNGGTSPYTYSWNSSSGKVLLAQAIQSVSETNTSTYTVTITDANSCSTTSSAVLTVKSGLKVTANSNLPGVCKGAQIKLSANANGGDGKYQYSWTSDNGLSSAYSSNSSITDNLNDTTIYIVTVKDGCTTPTAQDTVIVVAYPSPNASALTVGPSSGCDPFTAKFAVQGHQLGNSYTWNFGGSSQVSSTDSIQRTFAFNSSNQGIYSVGLTVMNSFGCIFKGPNVSIKVNENPIANFSTSPENVTILKPELSFIDKSIAGNNGMITNWAWEFGDNAFGSIQNPSHYYNISAASSFNIKLTVTNKEGCMGSTTKLIGIGDDFSFYIPDAFTPNGDGKNDTFRGEGLGIVDYEMHIFNRWGNEIFATYDYNRPWDGSAYNNGSIAQMDVYVYKIIITDFSKKKREFVGKVTLIR